MRGQNRLYGSIDYEVLGKVINIDDPEKMKRIKVSVPELGMTENETLPWALPCLLGKSDFLPKVGDYVWIRFRGFNPSKPIYVGLAFAKDQIKKDFIDNYTNENRVDYDDVGNMRIWDKTGWQIISASGDKITLYNDTENPTNNYISINDTFGNEILMNKDGIKKTDCNGNEEEFRQGEIKYKGTLFNIFNAGESAILGNKLYDKLLNFFTTLSTITGGNQGTNAAAINTIKTSAVLILSTLNEILSQKVFLE